MNDNFSLTFQHQAYIKKTCLFSFDILKPTSHKQLSISYTICEWGWLWMDGQKNIVGIGHFCDWYRMTQIYFICKVV